MIILNWMACAHSVNMVQTGFVQVPRQRRRRLPPKEAWLLVFRALVLTADFIRHSVGCVDMVLQRPTVTGSDIVISPVRHSDRPVEVQVQGDDGLPAAFKFKLAPAATFSYRD